MQRYTELLKETITVLHLKVGGQLQEVTVDDDYRSLQKLVGGIMTTLPYIVKVEGGGVVQFDKYDIVVNDNAVNKPFNFLFDYGTGTMPINGDIFIAKNNKGDFWTSLTQDDITFINNTFWGVG